MVLLFIPQWYLIYKQPDLSTSIVLLVIFCVIMFVGGISYKIIGGILLVAIPAVAVIFTLAMQPGETVLQDYQKDRILAFFWDSCQVGSPDSYAELKIRHLSRSFFCNCFIATPPLSPQGEGGFFMGGRKIKN